MRRQLVRSSHFDEIPAETARRMHDETLADDYFKTGRVLLDVWAERLPKHNFREVDWERLEKVASGSGAV
jgi:phosphomethylpyrimidine synthase